MIASLRALNEQNKTQNVNSHFDQGVDKQNSEEKKTVHGNLVQSLDGRNETQNMIFRDSLTKSLDRSLFIKAQRAE